MSYIGNKPFTQAERKVQDHVTTASKTIYPISGGYSAGFIDVILNGVTLQSSEYIATDGLNVQLLEATAAGDTLTTVAWGTFVVADVVQPNDPRLATAWCSFDGTLTGTNPPTAGYNVASVERTGAGSYTITFTTSMDNANFSAVASSQLSHSVTQTPTTANVGVRTRDNSHVNADTVYTSVQVFGGKN